LPHTLTSQSSLRLREAEAEQQQPREAEAGAVQQQPQEAEAGAVQQQPREAEAGAAVLEPGEAGQVVHNCFAAQTTANAKSPRRCWKMSGRSG